MHLSTIIQLLFCYDMRVPNPQRPSQADAFNLTYFCNNCTPQTLTFTALRVLSSASRLSHEPTHGGVQRFEQLLAKLQVVLASCCAFHIAPALTLTSHIGLSFVNQISSLSFLIHTKLCCSTSEVVLLGHTLSFPLQCASLRIQFRDAVIKPHTVSLSLSSYSFWRTSILDSWMK